MALLNRFALALSLAAVLCPVAVTPLHAGDSSDLRQEIEALQKQNAVLLEQLQKQQSLINGLTHKVDDLQQSSSKPARKIEDVEPEAPAPAAYGGFNVSKVHLSGEGGVGFFNTDKEGFAPNSEFRVHEASLFVEAPVWDDVYFYSEVYITQLEASDLNLNAGELYLDFEDVSKLWGRERMLNIRAGRMNIPFGEEYLHRHAIDNPLISHSVVDFWGVDDGIELYGSAGKFSYVIAAQNGGAVTTRDFNADKAIVARLGYDPTSWLHLSTSAMRTGDLDANNDFLSELWFAGGWFRSIGSAATTKFHANLVQGNVELKLPRGQVRAFGGYACYGDNDPSADNHRGFYFYSVEGLCPVTQKLYAVARFSQIMVDNGAYPLTGNGTMGQYLFTPNTAEWTTEIWRLSLGLGWRFSENLVTKAEYSFEGGREAGGDKRNHEDLFAVEAAFKF